MKKKNETEEVAEQSEEIILTEFRLKKNGLQLEYTTYEPMKKGTLTMNGEVKRKSPFPPTHDVLVQVDRLRYFFAKACGMWYDGFDEFIGSDFKIGPSEGKDFVEFTKANNTLEAIHIDQVKIGDSYKIGASVESMNGKYIHTITPNITENDEIFDQLNEVMGQVLETMKEFIKDSKYDIRKEAYDIVFRSIQNKEERLEVMNNMTERDILLSAIEIFENKGAMLMMSPELDKEIMDMRKEKELEESVGKSNGLDITSNDIEKTDLNTAQDFSEKESVHETVSEKTAEQDWALGFVKSQENADKETLVAEEFM